MKIGKISETILKRTIFKTLNVKRDEVIIGPSVGRDCSVLQFAEDDLFVVSTDPITATSKDIGTLAINITANDLAASGAESVGVMLTILLPPDFAEEELKIIIQDINYICQKENIQVIGGHTEITAAVIQPIISVTGIGKIKKDKLIDNRNAKVDQDVVMTKWTGIEGTAIIAKEKEEVLKTYYNSEFVERAKDMSQHLSVVKEGKIAIDFGVSAMHDATEGGIFGALWEIGESANLGLEIWLDKIPIKQETVEICEYFNLNPYKLISSGVMIIISNSGQALIEALEKENIPAAIIGKTVEGNKRIVIQADSIRSLEPPKSDEIYKVNEL